MEEGGMKNCSGVPSLGTKHTTIKYSQQYTESSWTNIKKSLQHTSSPFVCKMVWVIKTWQIKISNS